MAPSGPSPAGDLAADDATPVDLPLVDFSPNAGSFDDSWADDNSMPGNADEPDLGFELPPWSDLPTALDSPSASSSFDVAGAPPPIHVRAAAGNASSGGSLPPGSDLPPATDAQPSVVNVSLSMNVQLSLEATEQQAAAATRALWSVARSAVDHVLDGHQQNLSAYRAVVRAALGGR